MELEGIVALGVKGLRVFSQLGNGFQGSMNPKLRDPFLPKEYHEINIIIK